MCVCASHQSTRIPPFAPASPFYEAITVIENGAAGVVAAVVPPAVDYGLASARAPGPNVSVVLFGDFSFLASFIVRIKKTIAPGVSGVPSHGRIRSVRYPPMIYWPSRNRVRVTRLLGCESFQK